MAYNAAFAILGEDDNSYDALALAKIAKAMIDGLNAGVTPLEYANYAGPSPDGMEDLLERPLTAAIAEEWLEMAQVALDDLGG